MNFQIEIVSLIFTYPKMLINNFNTSRTYQKPKLSNIDINFIDFTGDFTKEEPLLKPFKYVLEKNYEKIQEYANAPILALNMWKQTPLMLAVLLNDERAIRILRNKDVGHCDKLGRTAKDLIKDESKKYLLNCYE